MENTRNKVPFKETMAGPTVVLLLICLVISAALAFTYQITKPKIDQINKETADNGSGCVITCETKSFGGTITVMVGIDPAGAVTGVKVTQHSDTPGVGTKAMDASYLKEQYTGKTETENAGNIRDDSTVDQVTGATVSSNAIYQCVSTALNAFSETGGAQS